MNNQKAAGSLLLAGLALCVLQVWLPAYYITGDGPCHLYNARILHDLWVHKNTAFYSRFYELAYKPNPNWMSHLALALLLFLVDGAIAEKILLTGYILLFVAGFYVLVKRLDNKSAYWPLVIFIFVFHYVLAKGFYNFSFGIAFLFWLIATWLRYLEHRRPSTAAVFFLLSVLTFFAHPIAFAFGGITCFALTVSYALPRSLPGRHGKMKSLMTSIAVLILCLLPCGALFAWFAKAEGGEGIHLHLHGTRIGTLADLDSLVNLTSTEAMPLKIMSVFLFTLLLCALVLRHRKGCNFHKYDGLFFSLFFAGILSMIFPDSLFGGSLFIIRVQFIIALFTVCCISYMVQAEKIKNIAGILLFTCFAGLSFTRMDRREAASSGVSDLLSASKYIKPYSVLLPLDFSPGGTNKYGKDITNRNWLFCHAAQYMGAEKPLIILDNYEAAMGYFPLTWKSEVNPYAHLCTNGQIEAQPPYVTIADYKNKTGVTIDYILMWCYDPGWLWDRDFSKLYAEIDAGYHIIYTSATGRTILFEQNRKP